MIDNDYFSHRATVRNYNGNHIPENVLKSILSRAMHAPTCGNMQLYSVIVTRDALRKKTLAEQHFNQPAATGSDVILTICADFHRFCQWCHTGNAQPGYENFHSFMMAMTDAVILTQQIVTIAEMEGIGTCYLGTVNYNAKEISRILELPSLVVPVASISLGFPQKAALPSEKLPIEAIVHQEKYKIPTNDEIRRFYSEIENNPENIKFVKENNKESLAQVFADIRYNLETNLTVSRDYLSLLNDKKFFTSSNNPGHEANSE